MTGLLAAALAGVVAAQGSTWTSQVPYVSSPPQVVAQMLRLAEVGSGDVVYDLGCGDGRIVIAAVSVPGVRGVCVEIEPDVIQEARVNAQRAGVADRIRFVQGDMFEVPLGDATVVAIYLQPKVNLRLRPRLLSELTPGARVVSHAWDMGDWAPDRKVVVDLPPNRRAVVYRWTIPERSASSRPAEPSPSQPDPGCGMRAGDWCPAPAGDPCGAHKDVASCRADARCGGMPYRGESVMACRFDERGFGTNCPTVGCVSLKR